MDITDSKANEVRYQHRGYGKYVEIVNLFGWKVLEDFWHSVNQDYLEGIKYPRNTDPTDNAEHARVVNPKGARGKARYSARGGIMPRCRTTTTPTARPPGGRFAEYGRARP
jgi:hypothetical protein